MSDPRDAMRSAHWCFRTLRGCKDPQMASELRFLAQSLVRQARAKLDAMRARRKALADAKPPVLKQSA